MGHEADADRAERVITAATDFVARKYGVVFDDSYSFVIRLNVGTFRRQPGAVYACCYGITDWADLTKTRTRSDVIVGALDSAEGERDLTLQFMHLVHDRFAKAGWLFEQPTTSAWLSVGLAELDARYALGASPANVHADLVQWTRTHRSNIDARFTAEDDTIWFEDPAAGGAAFLQFLAEQLGDDVHRRILQEPASSLSEALRAVSRNQLWSLYQSFLRWE